MSPNISFKLIATNFPLKTLDDTYCPRVNTEHIHFSLMSPSTSELGGIGLQIIQGNTGLRVSFSYC